MKASSLFLRTVILAAVLALTLGSCGGVSTGMFSSELVQMSARVDLSAEIPASDASSFQLAILKLLGTEYVLLFSSDSADPDRTHLFVLSETLGVLNRYSLNDIDTGVAPGTTPFLGNAAVTRLLDNTIVIGNVVAQASSSGLILTAKLPAGANLRNGAIVGPSPGGITMTGFYSNSDGTVHYDVYDSAWNLIASPSQPAGRPGWIRGVFTDPGDAANNTAFLVLEANDFSTDYFVQVPKLPDLAGGWPSPDILDNTSYPQFTKTGINGTSVSITAQGIVAYENSTQSWIRFLPSAPDAVKSLPVGQRDTSRPTAFSYAEGYYCTFDPASRVLTRYEKWW